ncbi:MAG: serine protease [Oscillospiraceae bacterium]|nr:serine protease [Oscillospiraceae bacterium]
MKKVKLLPLLAILALMTMPAQAAGRCEAVREETPRLIIRRCPWTWGNFALPDFYCPNASAPDAASPDANANAPDTASPAVPAPDTTRPNAPTVPDNATPNTPAPANSGMSAYETEVVRLVNVERARYGLAALSADAELSRGARAKSQDMRDKGYFSHESPTYGSPFQMMKSFGISYRTAGENIAYGYSTPEKAVQAWMNSEGHRANILNSSYTRLGVGYVADGHYWTQWFVG